MSERKRGMRLFCLAPLLREPFRVSRGGKIHKKKNENNKRDEKRKSREREIESNQGDEGKKAKIEASIKRKLRMRNRITIV